jgi:two-component system LytT family response regulator
MIKVLIIEDEHHTALRLKKLLVEIDPGIEVIEILDSVESSIGWLKSNKHPDLIFQDIQLADGSCFRIYEEVKLESPVIFTTAYDQYAIDAFKLNSVDYLLKPIKKQELKDSLSKFKKIHQQDSSGKIDFETLAKIINKGEYQKRFVVRFGNTIKAIETEDIAYFYSDSGNIFFKTFDNSSFPLDLSIDKIEPLIDPQKFYRINRQFLINFKSIKEMYGYSKSRVRIILDPPCEQETIASTDRSGQFKKWLTGK